MWQLRSTRWTCGMRFGDWRLGWMVWGADTPPLLIAPHSPILLAYPGAQIFSFDEGKIHEARYQETSPYQSVSRFLARPDVYLKELFGELPMRLDQKAEPRIIQPVAVAAFNLVD